MKSVYERLNISRSIFKKKIERLYYYKEYSQKMIADYFRCDLTVIEKWFKKFNIKTRSVSDAHHLISRRNRPRKLNKKESSILDGLLLGDGHLELSNSGKAARYSHGSKYRETLKKIANDLKSLKFSEPKKINGYWFFKSKTYEFLVQVHKRWYAKKKIIPKDIVLNRSVCYNWFVGDGCRANGRYDLQLSTDGFSKNDVIRISRMLQKKGFKNGVSKNNRIRISSKDVPNFYKLIGVCKNPEYEYKWAYNKPKWTFQRKQVRGKKI